VTLRAKGARELRRELRKAGDDLQDMRTAHRDAAEIAADASAALAPEKSGRLKDTIRAAGTKTAAIVRAGYARVPYPGVVHWGWPARNIQAQPFLSDGARDSEGRWMRVYEEYVDTALSKVKGATSP
jgi:hypothetical protein